LKGFEETREGERRKPRASAETSASGALGLASAVGNQGMQRIAASPEAGRVGPGVLSGSAGVLARSSVDEDTGQEEEPGALEAAEISAPEEAEEDATVD
jgi:hypothetical protein